MNIYAVCIIYTSFIHF